MSRTNGNRFNRAGRMAIMFGLTAILGAMPATAQVLTPPPGTANSGGEGDPFTNVNAPKITFEAVDHDLGPVSDLTPRSLVFVFTNTGNGLLTVNAVHTTCSCTVAELRIRDYLPGESGRIEVTFDPREKSGQQYKTIRLECNDPTTPLVELHVKSEIVPVVKLATPGVHFGDVIARLGATQTFSLSSDRAGFEIKSMTINAAGVSGTILGDEMTTGPDGRPERKYNMEFKVAPGTPVGWLSGFVDLATVLADDAGEMIDHPVKVSLTGQLVGDVKVDPNQIRFGTPNAGETFTNEIRVVGRTDRAFNVTSVDVEIIPMAGGPLGAAPSGEPLRMTSTAEKATPANGPSQVVVKLSGTYPTMAGLFRGRVIIHTDLADQPTIEVAYFGNIRVIR